MTKGTYTFDWGDQAASAPIVTPMACTRRATPSSRRPKVHAGGLRYHGMAPSVSALVNHGDIEARAVQQLETFAAAVQFSKAEGTPALAKRFRCKCHPRPRERPCHPGGDRRSAQV